MTSANIRIPAATMSQFRFQFGTPGIYDSNGEFDGWLRRLLSYLRLNDQTYKTIAAHYMENLGRTLLED